MDNFQDMTPPSKRLGLGILILVGGIGLYLFSQGRSSSPMRSSPAPGERATAASAPSTVLGADPAMVRELEGRLAAETSARLKAESTAATLRAGIAPLEGNVVVSLGSIEHMGKRTGMILPALRELRELSSRDRATLSAEEKRRLLDLQRQHADVLGMLPEIASFQDNPAEYANFFRNMVQQAAGLTTPEADAVAAYMHQRAVGLNEQGLNTAKEPTDPAKEEPWEEKRDEYNVETANGLRALLPPPAADAAGITPQLLEFLERDFDKAEGVAPVKVP